MLDSQSRLLRAHTFVSIFGEDAILTDTAKDEEAYASRMKGGGV